MRGHRSDRGIAHAGQQIVVGHVARADQLDAGFVETTLGELLHEGAALAGRHEDEDRVRLGIGRALQERREIRIGERHLDRFDDLAAGRLEAFGERFFRVDARRIVGDDGDDFLDVILRRPVGDDDATTAAR